MNDFPRAYQVLYYLIKNFAGAFRRAAKRTELIKIIYLTDLNYYKKYGVKFTEFDYVFYKYGPWTPQFQELLDYMRNEEILEAERPSGDGKTFFTYGITKKKPRHDVELAAEVKSIIKENLFIYRESQLQQILDAVYKQEPMASTERNSRIDFSKVPLDARARRMEFKRGRRKQLEKLALSKNRPTQEEDMDLFYQFKPLRAKANQLI